MISEEFGSIAIAVELGLACVGVGERQTITIRTEPRIPVAYQAVYADGKTAFDPTYYGGNNGDTTNDEGVWGDSWVVGLGAPPGHVRVDVIAQSPDDSGYAEADFEVAGEDGTCV